MIFIQLLLCESYYAGGIELAESGSSKRFFFADTGNEILVVLIERNQFYQLNKLINIFTPFTQA